MNTMKRKIHKFKNYQFSANQLIVVSSLYIALVCNLPFLIRAIKAATITTDYSLLFILSIPILLTSLVIIINSVLGIALLLKPLLIVSLITSSLLFYATFTYGIVFDKTMIQNAFETDTAELFTYVNAYSILFLLITGVLPVALILLAKVKREPIGLALKSRLRVFAVNVALVITIANFFFANYASVGRNNHELLGYITPYKFIDASVKYINIHYLSSELPFKMLDTMALIKQTEPTPNVTILVVGETARAQNFSLNGYWRNTNPYTTNKGIVSFSNMSSCGTATAVSLPCMFSRLDRSNYDNRHANAQQNLLDFASVAGMDVLWIDNNNGSCKGVCARVNTIDIEPNIENPFCDGEYCLDEALLEPLQDKLDNLQSNHTLIVLHMMGSHGPTYYKRYSSDKRLFMPDCPRSDIQHCSEQEVINTYDNTIAYTDFVLSEIISKLENLEITKNVKTSMLYVSDHGESLGEKGVYLHGLPYAFAPKEQTHVPMLYWQSNAFTAQEASCYESVSKEAISHDNLFDIVLGITSVASTHYIETRDKLAACRTQAYSLLH